MFKEIVDRLRGMGALNEADMFGVAFNIEYMKKILEDLCEENSVDLLYNTTVTERMYPRAMSVRSPRIIAAVSANFTQSIY